MKIYDSNQHKVGDVNQYGTVTNNEGRKVGEVDMANDDHLNFAGGAALLLLFQTNT